VKLGASVLVVFALLAAACGSRLPDDTLKALDARGSSGALTSANSNDAVDDGTGASSDQSASASGNSAGSGSSSGGSSSGASSSGGGATQSGAGASTGACTPNSATTTGVSPKEIKVASIVTDSGPLPGATEGSYRGAASYFAKVNAEGGVCGRKITILKGDDGLDPAKGRAEFLRLEPKVLSFVGSFAVADSGYVDQIQKTGVPYVSLTVDPSGADIPNVYPKGRRDIVNTAPFVWWKQQHPNVKKAGLLYADIGGVSANVPGFEQAIKRAGFDIVHKEGVRVTDPDYTGIIRNLQSEGVEFLYLFAFEVNMHVRFVRNMQQQNYNPVIKGANIAFNTRFSELLGKDGDGWENHQVFLPFLDPAEKGRSKALADFIDWNNRVYPGGQLDLFPVDGWGYAALFVDALKIIGSGPVNRKTLMDALFKVPKFDLGGINAATNPSTGDGDRCFVMAKLVGGTWKREWPASGGYECNVGELYKFK
jgi:ABC-type branched-subunit amino acid transport system substrate-binding protein